MKNYVLTCQFVFETLEMTKNLHVTVRKGTANYRKRHKILLRALTTYKWYAGKPDIVSIAEFKCYIIRQMIEIPPTRWCCCEHLFIERYSAFVNEYHSNLSQIMNSIRAVP